MPRFAHHAALLHFHDYIPPHSDPHDKIYAHRRRDRHHTYAVPQPDLKIEDPEPHEDGNVHLKEPLPKGVGYK